MRNEIAVKEINGIKVVRLRGIMKCHKIFRDKNRYSRKIKHRQGRSEW